MDGHQVSKQDKDGEDINRSSDVDSVEDDISDGARDYFKKSQSVPMGRQSIMRRPNFVMEGLGAMQSAEYGNLENFYEEPLEKEDFDTDLIKRMFGGRKIMFTHETRMKRYFKNEFTTAGNTQRTTRTDLSGANSQSNSENSNSEDEGTYTQISGTEELLKNIGGTQTPSDPSEYDNMIVPVKSHKKRQTISEEQKQKLLAGTALATQARAGANP